MRSEMIAMAPESVQSHSRGMSLSSYVQRHGGDERDANRICNDRRWRYGHYRPSDRAAALVDCTPEMTPYAPDDLVAA